MVNSVLRPNELIADGGKASVGITQQSTILSLMPLSSNGPQFGSF
jgi:hypothetical protein